MRMQPEGSSPEPGPGDTLIFGLLASRTMKNKFLLFISHSNYVFVIAAVVDEDIWADMRHGDISLGVSSVWVILNV